MRRCEGTQFSARAMLDCQGKEAPILKLQPIHQVSMTLPALVLVNEYAFQGY